MKESPFNDKNGKAICDGDILRDLGVVEEYSGEWGVQIAYDQTFIRLQDCDANEIEIIGHKDTHPELAKFYGRD